MSHRNVSRIGLALVVLGVVSVAFWWSRSGAPTHGAKGTDPAVQRAAGQTAAPAAARTEPRSPMVEAASGPSDRSDKADKTTVAPDATISPATAQQPAAAPAPAVIAPAVARFADASIPLDKRMAEID